MKANKKKWERKTLVRYLLGILVLAGIFLYFLSLYSSSPDPHTTEDSVPEKMVKVGDSEEIEGGMHVATGLIADEGLNAVIAHCTGCHSSKLIIQNRATREGWVRLIRWMQDTQNLWDLGDSEEEIVNYLVKNYAPQGQGRRAPLTDIDWYELRE